MLVKTTSPGMEGSWLRATNYSLDPMRDPFVLRKKPRSWWRSFQLCAVGRDALRERRNYSAISGASDRRRRWSGAGIHFSSWGSAKAARIGQVEIDHRFDRWRQRAQLCHARQTLSYGAGRRSVVPDWQELVGFNIRFEGWFPSSRGRSRLSEVASLHVGWKALSLQRDAVWASPLIPSFSTKL